MTTRGVLGVDAVDAKNTYHVDALRLKSVDTTGAGDACTAGIAVALAEGTDISTALKFGNATGGAAVLKAGTTTAFPDRGLVDSILYGLGAYQANTR